jgi:hypothetical protein
MIAMGLLLNSDYWAKLSTEMWDARPQGDWQTITEADANKIREIGCRAFSRLVEDPALSADIAYVQGLSEEGIRAYQPVEGFFDAFIQAERTLFNNAGRHVGVTDEILSDLTVLQDEILDLYGWERFEEQIRYLQTLICDEASNSNEVGPAAHQRAWAGVKSALVIGTDAIGHIGAAGVGGAVGGPAGAALGAGVGLPFALSINGGRLHLVREALRNAW